MKKLNLLMVILAGAIVFSCGGPKKQKDEPILENKNTYELIKSLDWMLGSWQNVSDQGTMTETWTLLNDSIYTGKSIFMEGKDTVFTEDITIEQRGNEVFYIPVIKDQNQGKPTLFKLSSNKTDGQVASFENPEHDFPQIISYELKGDSLMAEISGKMEGKDHAEQFPMVKVK